MRHWDGNYLEAVRGVKALGIYFYAFGWKCLEIHMISGYYFSSSLKHYFS